MYTTSLDGHLALWDTTDGALLRVSEYSPLFSIQPHPLFVLYLQVIDFGIPLYKLAICPKHSDPSVFLLIGAKGVIIVPLKLTNPLTHS